MVLILKGIISSCACALHTVTTKSNRRRSGEKPSPRVESRAQKRPRILLFVRRMDLGRE